MCTPNPEEGAWLAPNLNPEEGAWLALNLNPEEGAWLALNPEEGAWLAPNLNPEEGAWLALNPEEGAWLAPNPNPEEDFSGCDPQKTHAASDCLFCIRQASQLQEPAGGLKPAGEEREGEEEKGAVELDRGVLLALGELEVCDHSDHNPLRFLSKMRNSNQRLMRWNLILQPYDLEIMHVRGSDNILADALSRGH